MNEKKKPFAKKSFGQNFLVDQNYIKKIVSAVGPGKDDTILEIGPGRGALTRELVGSAGRVLAIELDRDLAGVLASEFDGQENFELIQADALDIDFADLLKDSRAKLVANLPYNISTAILQKLIGHRDCFTEMTLMFQKEVVQRITAGTDSSERGYLTVLVEAYLTTEKLFDVPSAAFRPVPKVENSVARLTPNNDRSIKIDNEGLFQELISQSFRQKRKTLQNNLKNATGRLKSLIEQSAGLGSVFEKAGLDGRERAEVIPIDVWISLSNHLNQYCEQS